MPIRTLWIWDEQDIILSQFLMGTGFFERNKRKYFTHIPGLQVSTALTSTHHHWTLLVLQESSPVFQSKESSRFAEKLIVCIATMSVSDAHTHHLLIDQKEKINDWSSIYQESKVTFSLNVFITCELIPQVWVLSNIGIRVANVLTIHNDLLTQ